MKLAVQKTIRMSMVVLIIVAAFSLNSAAQAPEKFILSTTEFTVKSGHEHDFEETSR